MKELNQALDEIENYREEIIEKLVEFTLTDTLVFWGNEKDLIQSQQKTWAPIIKWAEDLLKTTIKETSGLEVPKENLESGHKVKSFLQSLTNKELAGFYKSALLMKSVLLAMAFVKGKINAQEAFEAALLEEMWQNQIWGATDEVIENQEKFRQDLVDIEAFLRQE